MQRSFDALGAFAAAYAGLIVAAIALPHTTAMLAVKQIVCVAGPAVAFAVWRVGDWRDGLGATMPRALAWLGAVLVGGSFWYLNLWITLPVLERLGAAEAIDAANRSMTWGDADVVVRVAVVAVLPAVCEELLLRGVVARSLAPRFGIAGAVLGSTLLFSLMHFPAIRMVPVGLFGLTLGFAAVTTGSVWPCMVMHLLNNLAAVALVSISPGAVRAIESHPDASGVLAVAATGAGIALLWRSRPKPAL